MVTRGLELVHGGNSLVNNANDGFNFTKSVLSEMDLTLLIFHVMQSLELWDIREKNTMTFNNAHDGLVAALASSSATGKVASVSHDRTLKLWK